MIWWSICFAMQIKIQQKGLNLPNASESERDSLFVP